MELQIDHISFPVYNNFEFLKEVEDNWKKYANGLVEIGKDRPAFTGVFYYSKNFYVEHLSTQKDDGYWCNTVYVVVDKKYWGHYENPKFLNEHWLKPDSRSGFAIFSPATPFLNSSLKKDISYDGLKILISKTLENELTNLCGLKWKLPSYMTVHEKLLHAYDMAVINENDRLIAPLHQSNYPLNYW